MLWLASLLIVFTLLIAPNKRPVSFLFFIATVDYPLFYIFSFDAPNAFLSIEGKAKIRNSLNNARLAVFAWSIFFALIRHSCNHDICFSSWHTAQRLRGAGEISTYISVLWLPP
jgi:hypothetical protein